MKYAIIIFLICSVFAFADNSTLKIEVETEAGYSPMRKLVSYSDSDCHDGSAFTRMTSTLVLLDTIFIGGLFDCSFLWKEDVGGIPFLMNYGFWAGLRWGSFEIGFRHHCIHPVINKSGNITTVRGGAWEEIYIKIEAVIEVIH